MPPTWANAYSHIAMPPRRSRKREWCFTLNLAAEPIDNEAAANELMATLKEGGGTPELVAFQLERGEQGTYHYQGVIFFVNAVRFNTVRARAPNAHWEMQRGTRRQSYTYVTKEETRIAGPWVWHTDDLDLDALLKEAQGSRSDLEVLFSMAREGKSEREMADTAPGSYVRYGRAIREARYMVQEHKRREPLKVLLITGPPGVGKSRAFWDGAFMWGPEKLYSKVDGRWWDGYHHQQLVLIDDFDWSKVDIKNVLKWLDHYPVNFPVKGAFVAAAYTHVVIIDNYEPDNWWEKRPLDQHLEALRRRITHRAVIYGDPNGAPLWDWLDTGHPRSDWDFLLAEEEGAAAEPEEGEVIVID